MEAFRMANTSLAVDILKMFSEKNATENFILSPICISSCLAFIHKGAKGNTASEIEKALHYEQVKDHDFRFQTLTSDISKLCSMSSLKVVKKIFVDSSHECTKEFLKLIKRPNSTELESIDIKTRVEEARNQINTLVKDLTDGNMETVLDNGSLDEKTSMVLLAAVCLKGCWMYKFNESETKEAEFKKSKTETEPVQMMQIEARLGFRSLKEENLTIVEIPYAGKHMTLTLLLPNTIEDDSNGLKKVEQEMTSEKYVEWTNPSMMISSKVKLSLPKFNIESCYNLKETLNSLGIKDAFNEEVADFSGMSESKGLTVSQAFCKTVIEITEDGSETADGTRDRYLLPKNECVADHPFFFFVKHNKTQNILLCGRYCGPN